MLVGPRELGPPLPPLPLKLLKEEPLEKLELPKLLDPPPPGPRLVAEEVGFEKLDAPDRSTVFPGSAVGGAYTSFTGVEVPKRSLFAG